MIREELRQLKTGTKQLRKFGLMVGGVFLVLGAWFLFRHKPWYPWCFVPGVPLVGLGLAYPRALREAYLAWMAMALVLGLIVSTVLLVLFFYLVVAPTGLVARLLGRDFLAMRGASRASYWLPRQSGARSLNDYERQF